MANKQQNKLNSFLSQYKTKKGKGGEVTHTRIGDESLSVYPGAYHIPETELELFYQLYTSHIFEHGNQEYLTEKQLPQGPICIDIDFRYHSSVDRRQHKKYHINDLLQCILEYFKKLFKLDNDSCIRIMIFEKPKVNMLDSITKDGIHIIMNVSADVATKMILRKHLIKEIQNTWDDIPIVNSWEDVFDEAVMNCRNNWQMIGSQKPGNKKYSLTYYYNAMFSQGEWSLNELPIQVDYTKEYREFSVRTMSLVKWDLHDSMIEQHKSVSSVKTIKTSMQMNALKQEVHPRDIENEEQLDEAIDILMQNLTPQKYIIKETHDFTMCLPKSYWGIGSYNKWIKVCWALKNTHKKLLLTWIKFSSQSPDFSYSDIPDLCDRWDKIYYNDIIGVTNRSIIYWVKEDCPQNYYNIHRSTVDYFMNESVKELNEVNVATVLYHLYKDKYVCVGIKDDKWYEFINHKWEEVDSGTTLRYKISSVLFEKYTTKLERDQKKLSGIDPDNSEWTILKEWCKKITDCAQRVKTGVFKNSVMREAKELFFDKIFWTKIDTNPYLMCFNNGVIDFETNEFRYGKAEDYITKSTLIDYIPYDSIPHETINEVDEFMDQLFPLPQLNAYMWEHLASTLVGTNENQTFNIYIGSGANGKSKLVDFMTKVLGEYKGTLPITALTQKRSGIGSVSPEIAQLVGVRYAVMQEPSKGDKINEGIMKELTGGDPVQCRALYSSSKTFIPQFKLGVCTNNLFDITSNDDGTWRRIRVVDFQSKFTDNPYNDIKFPKDDYPHQFPIDRKIDEKFDLWKYAFMGKLVNIAFKTGGRVNDCEYVIAKSSAYRDGQDYFAEFIKDKIQHKDGAKIKKTEALREFSSWFSSLYHQQIPKGAELYEYLNKRFGGYVKGKGWVNVAIVYDD